MDIKRIVVDELPSQCLRCKYFRIAYTTLPDMDFCNVMNKYMDSEDIYTRPSWCPLQVEEECRWEKFGRVYEGDYGWKTTYDLLDHPSLIADIYDRDVDFKYCQYCGKRIRYVEE